MRGKLIIDNRFASVAQAHWGDRYEIIPSMNAGGLPQSVSAHPDMSFVRVGEVYVAEPSVYPYYKTHFPSLPILCGERKLSRNYPQDIAYNVLISERTAFGNIPFMDSVLKDALISQNYHLVHVNQGYAKCSSAVFGNHIITADPSLSRAARGAGFSVLDISSGGVLLPGFEYGFIGGASGFIDGTMLFFGDITKHADYEKICAFVKKSGAEILYMEDISLTDVGTIIGIFE